MQVNLVDALNGPLPYMVLAVGLLLGSFGLPLPASVLATVAGSLAADRDLDPTATAVISLAACVAGDLLGYAVGRLVGRRVLSGNRWFSVNPRWLGRMDRWFAHWSGPVLLLTRSVLAIAGSAVNVVAGASRQNLARFLILDLLGRLVWVAIFVGAGYVAAGSTTGLIEVNVLSGLSGPAGLVVLAVVFGMLQSPRLAPAPTRR